MQKFTLIIHLLVIFSFSTVAQNFPVPIHEKIEQSALILEGKIVSKKSYLAEDTRIHTENVLEISKIHKGETTNEKVSIITYGGTVNEKTTFWSHLLELNLNEYGIFFLNPTQRNIPENSEYTTFDVFSGSQGFYHFQKQDNGIYNAIANLDKYNSINEFYQTIDTKDLNENTFISPLEFVNEDDCLSFKIEPATNSSANSTASNPLESNSQVWFNVMVKVNDGYYKLNKSELLLKYSTEWFYENMADEGYITFVQGEFDNSAYNIQIDNNEPDVLKLRTEATTNNYNDLESVEEEWKLLVSVGVTIKNISNEDPLQQLLDNSNIIENNYRTIAGYLNDFECVKLDYGANCGMEITAITAQAAAGVGLESENGITGVIEIQGDNFLDDDAEIGACIKPNNHHVKFTTINGGWIAPFEGDYLEYTNNLIRVKVPSLGYDNNSSDIISNLNTQIACSGKVRVCREGLFGINCGCFVTSDEELYIPFSARNQSQPNENGCRESLRVVLRNANEMGGYEIFLEDEFRDDADAVMSFRNALTTWRCATRVNFSLNEDAPFPSGFGNCLVGFEDLPVGTTTTRAQTSVAGPFCGPMPNANFTEITEFEILFNENIDWDGGGSANLESTALHELGHAHLLMHTCNGEDKVMHPSKTIVVTDLENDSENGGNHLSLLGSTSNDPNCPHNEMVLIDLDDCLVSTSDITVKGKKIEVLLFPNPSSDNIQVSFQSKEFIPNGKIHIIDSSGKTLTERSIIQKNTIIDISNLEKGIFFLMFEEDSNGKELIGKFSKN